MGRGADEHAVLDADAKAAYRRRIEDLRSEIDDAEACTDVERTVRARVELDRFAEEPARSTGFAGRARSFSHNAERARVSVHKAIKRAVSAIAEIDPVIGSAVTAWLATGNNCVFLAGGPDT